MRILCAILLTIFSMNALASTKVLNLYTWANYVPQQVIREFEQQTGITVNVTNFDNNQTMFSKLQADPHIGYDVIIPSSYYVERMRKLGMLHKIDLHKVPNLHNIKPGLLNQAYDPHNQYSVPYVWGMTGILVNKKYWNPKTIQHWSDFWQPRFKNQLMMLDDPREVFAIAFIKLGYSINTTNPKKIKQAYELLRQLMRNIKVFNTDSFTNIYIDADATVGMSWNGEAVKAMQENPNLVFIYPKEGFSMWVDCLAIPKYAPHYQNALKFINFILRPKIAKQIMLLEGYGLPNNKAIALLPAKLRDNPILNPPPSVVKRGTVQMYIGKARQLYNKYWELLKLGESSN